MVAGVDDQALALAFFAVALGVAFAAGLVARFFGAALVALGGGGGASASIFSRNARNRAVLASRCLASVSRIERAMLFVVLALESCLEGLGAKMPRAASLVLAM